MLHPPLFLTVLDNHLKYEKDAFYCIYFQMIIQIIANNGANRVRGDVIQRIEPWCKMLVDDQ